MLAFPWRCKRCLHSSSFLGCSAWFSPAEQQQQHLHFQRSYRVSFHSPGLFYAACSFRAAGGAPFHHTTVSDFRIHQRIKTDFPYKSWKKSVLIHKETDSRSCSCPAWVTCHISLCKEHISDHEKHRRNTNCTVQRVDAAELVSDEVSVFRKALQVPFAEKTY